MEQIVKTTMMVRSFEDAPTLRRVELEYYEKYAPHLVTNPPATNFAVLPAIGGTNSRIEIDATVVL